MKLGGGMRKRRKHEYSACEATGIWGGFTQGRRKSERKVEMLPGATHRRQTLCMERWGWGGIAGERRGKERSRMAPRSENTQKVGCFSAHWCAKHDKWIHRVWCPALFFLAEETKQTAEEWRQRNTLTQRSDLVEVHFGSFGVKVTVSKNRIVCDQFGQAPSDKIQLKVSTHPPVFL